jgi:hypothetical protein
MLRLKGVGGSTIVYGSTVSDGGLHASTVGRVTVQDSAFSGCGMSAARFHPGHVLVTGTCFHDRGGDEGGGIHVGGDCAVVEGRSPLFSSCVGGTAGGAVWTGMQCALEDANFTACQSPRARRKRCVFGVATMAWSHAVVFACGTGSGSGVFWARVEKWNQCCKRGSFVIVRQEGVLDDRSEPRTVLLCELCLFPELHEVVMQSGEGFAA